MIYIDGDHKGISVFNDLENSFKILNNGGIIICDDFLWSYYKLATNNPAYGIGIFLKKYKFFPLSIAYIPLSDPS